jgi:hypothetical protein
VFQALALLLSMILAAGASLWSGWRWLNREFQRVDRELRRARRKPGAPGVDLMIDPSTGVYLPAVDGQLRRR